MHERGRGRAWLEHPLRWRNLALELVMNLGPVARHYGALEPHERFTLMVEAMGRKDNAEADRLEELCPRFVYRDEDA